MEGKRIFRDSQDWKDFVTCLEDRSKQTATRILAWSLVGRVWSKITWILRREYEIAMAEIARRLGVCTSAIAKAIRKGRGRIKGVSGPGQVLQYYMLVFLGFMGT